MRSVVEELAPPFERTTGHKLHLTFGTTSALRRQIEAGEPFDVAIMGASFIDDLVTQGRLRRRHPHRRGAQRDRDRGAHGCSQT